MKQQASNKQARNMKRISNPKASQQLENSGPMMEKLRDGSWLAG